MMHLWLKNLNEFFAFIGVMETAFYKQEVSSVARG
jgi:hypothetical protein